MDGIGACRSDSGCWTDIAAGCQLGGAFFRRCCHLLDPRASLQSFTRCRQPGTTGVWVAQAGFRGFCFALSCPAPHILQVIIVIWMFSCSETLCVGQRACVCHWGSLPGSYVSRIKYKAGMLCFLRLQGAHARPVRHNGDALFRSSLATPAHHGAAGSQQRRC